MSNQQRRPDLEEVIALAKRRGFVYPSSEIYGGLANCYDYGPLGVEMLRKIRNAWWQKFITNRTDVVGLDSQILLHPMTWVASGHVESFTDPLVEDLETHKRYRVDHLIEDWLNQPENQAKFSDLVVEDMSVEQMDQFIKEHNIKSPEGNEVSEPKNFQLLFETAIGAVSGEKSKAYFRGETAQGIFTNFKNVLDTTRVQLPFGIGQIGRSFRNEVTTGQFIFRTLEFEQAEIEYFFDPNKSEWRELFQEWQEQMWQFVTQVLGVRAENIRWRRHTDQERSHYSRDTYDLDYHYPFGWKELWGIAYRTDYDLKQHQQYSGQNLSYPDPHTGEKIIPHVIEPALGINRVLLMLLVDSYWHDQENDRLVLKIKPNLAPYQAAIFPLLKNKLELVDEARKIYDSLKQKMAVAWDDRGNIGKRYLYQDEAGTPFCITTDFQTLEDQTVTVRDRDTTQQTRVSISQLEDYLRSVLG